MTDHYQPRDGAALQALLFAACRQLLATVEGPQKGEVYVEVSNRRRTRLCLVSEANSDTTAVQLPAEPGQSGELLALLARVLFSPDEREVVLKIGSEQLPGKAVASRTGRKLDTSLRLLLSNLVERGVLENTGRAGYRVTDSRLLELVRRTNSNSTEKPINPT